MFTCVKSLQSCSTLCDPMDSSPPRSFVDGILWARILEWVALKIMDFKAFLQGLPDPGIKPRSPHHRQLVYCLNH